jgi:hypothetical protein
LFSKRARLKFRRKKIKWFLPSVPECEKMEKPFEKKFGFPSFLFDTRVARWFIFKPKKSQFG